jgi:hypothetical protein
MLAITALAGVIVAGVVSSPGAWAESGRERLALGLQPITMAQMRQTEQVPEHDKGRTAVCLAAAIAKDVPEADAARLADILEGKAAPDRALQQKWLGISKKDAPARNAQVMAAVGKLCPDLGPYVAPMM